VPIYVGIFLLAGIFIGAAIYRPPSPILDAAYADKNSDHQSPDMQRLIDHSKVDQCWEDASHVSAGTLADAKNTCTSLEHEFNRKYDSKY
jgi:hypothetical protein